MESLPMTHEPRPAVSVVTVCYNHGSYLAEYVAALRRSSYPIAEIIVVDNASTDGSADLLRSLGVEVLINETNIGYAAALNQAFARARTALVCATGPDVVVEPDWLAPLVAIFTRDPERTFAVGSRVITLDRSEVQSAGASLHFTGHLCVYDMWRPLCDHGHSGGAAREVGAVDSTSALFDRAKFLAVGGCDEDFFVYHEEFDYCYRARARGWRCYYHPGSTVYHGAGSAEYSVRSGGQYPPRRPFLHTRNRLLAVLKNYQARTLVALLPVLLLLELLNVAMLARLGLHGAYADAVRWLWRNRKQIVLKRYTIQRSRAVGDRELLSADALTITPLLLRSAGLRAAKRALDGGLAAYWKLLRKVLYR